MKFSAAEKVPFEIMVEILRLLNSPKSLYALIRASPQYYRIFHANKALILSGLVKQMIRSEAIHDAIAAAVASQYNPRGPDPDIVGKLMSAYRDSKAEPSPSHVLPLSTSVLICRLHPSVEYHMRLLTKHALGALDRCGFKSFDFAAPFQKLTRTEEARLQRAFYRLEFYAALFYSDDKPRTRQCKIPPGEQEKMFLTSFAPWEVEEMACIWQCLHSYVGKLFDQLEDDFVKLIQEDSSQTAALRDFIFDEEQYDTRIERGSKTHGLEPFSGLTAAHCQKFFRPSGDNSFWTEIAKRELHDDYIEHILSLGLPFLRRLFNADRREQMRLVLENKSVNCQGFFSKAFRCWRMRAASRHDWKYDEIPPEGEGSIRGPNAGYRWANEGLGSVAGIGYVCRLRGGLRYLGFAFWDEERLRWAGILTQSVMVLDKRSCSEKLRGRRKDRASAETRLKRYFDAQNWGMADWKVNNYLE